MFSFLFDKNTIQTIVFANKLLTTDVIISYHGKIATVKEDFDNVGLERYPAKGCFRQTPTLPEVREILFGITIIFFLTSFYLLKVSTLASFFKRSSQTVNDATRVLISSRAYSCHQRHDRSALSLANA